MSNSHNILKRTISMFLCAIISLSLLTGCAVGNIKNGDETSASDGSQTSDEGKAPESTEPDESQKATEGKKMSEILVGDAEKAPLGVIKDPDSKFSAAYASFALNLLSAVNGTETAETSGEKLLKAENMLISPLSVYYALAMTANGAEGQTLSQMEKALGELTLDELNSYMAGYMRSLESLPDEEKKVAFNIANSIWFADNLPVMQDFLNVTAGAYTADIYKTPFDAGTVGDINSWVKDKTAGMIEKILDEIPEDVKMYLINAISFEADWAEQYKEGSIYNGVFTEADGTEKTVQMMHGSENKYISGDNVTGFIKNYAGGKYAFAALLPESGTTPEEYIASLDGETFASLILSASSEKVITTMPVFSFDGSYELAEALKACGITDSFDASLADFSKITGEKDLFISRVLHKTHIEVDGLGTKAGAVTAIVMETTGVFMTEPKTVNLDRPFVFAIVDVENNIPIFMGILNNID